jgi:hypothetical protein
MGMGLAPTPGGGAIPGSPSVRSRPAQQVMDLQKILGQSYIELGTELAKGPHGDPIKATRAHQKIKGVIAQMDGMSQPQQPQPSSNPAGGRPRPADKPIDALTHQPPADTNQSGSKLFTQP